MSYSTTMIDKPFSSTDTGYRSNNMYFTNIANSGAALNTPVSVQIAFTTPLPTNNYNLSITPNQGVIASYTSKLTTGFTVVLTPPNSSVAVASGTFDVTLEYCN